jgi:hypothetical protein
MSKVASRTQLHVIKVSIGICRWTKNEIVKSRVLTHMFVDGFGRANLRCKVKSSGNNYFMSH